MDIQLTRALANRARTSMCDVFTTDGDAAVVTHVHSDDTVTVNSHHADVDGRRYSFAELTIGADLHTLAKREELLG